MFWFRHRNDAGADSEEALRDAQRNLREVKERSDEVSTVSNALRDIRVQNHFGEALQEIIVRHGGKLNATRY